MPRKVGMDFAGGEVGMDFAVAVLAWFLKRGRLA